MSDTFEITSSPLAPMLPGGAALLVGVEREDDNALRLYLGARYEGIYTVIDPGDDADRIERAWGGSSQHLWLRPVPSALYRDEPS